jgi:trimeric autotransporter adhesin
MKHLPLLLAALCACAEDPASPPAEPPRRPAPVPEGAWTNDFILPGLLGVSGARVYATAVDANGELYAGGTFTAASEVAARNVARWDGARWHGLGDGLPISVFALAFAESGELYAGGDPGDTSGGDLYRWDGASWTSIGSFDGPVRTLLTDGTTLYAGGRFTQPGNALAEWNGTTWSGVSGFDPGAEIFDLHLTSAGDLCAGGFFQSDQGSPANSVACFDGESWAQLGNGFLYGSVSQLTQDNAGNWLAGGSFTITIDESTGAYRAGIARLEGDTWQPFAGGVENGSINEVRALYVDPEDRVWIGGCFGTAGDNPAVAALNVAMYDGEWHALGAGIRNRVGQGLAYVMGVNVITPYGAGFAIGGWFSSAGDEAAMNLALWTGLSLQPLVANSSPLFYGIPGFVDHLGVDASGVVWAGGSFTHAGVVPAANIARLDDEGWHAVGAGFDDVVRVITFATNGDVYAGGDFLGDGLPFNHVARWDGATWWPLDSGLSEGLYGTSAKAMVVAPDGSLYVGGAFTLAGSTPAANVARWNGTSWEAVGNGFDGDVTSLVFGPDGRLYAGGIFHASGETVVTGVARLSGNSWEPVGGSLDPESYDYVSTLAVYEGELVAAGTFTTIGGVAAVNVAAFDGTRWRALGDGLGGDYEVVSVILPGRGGLFAGGSFGYLGDGGPRSLAFYDGFTWHEIGGGLSDLPESLVLAQDALLAGGTFTVAGETASLGIGRFTFVEP